MFKRRLHHIVQRAVHSFNLLSEILFVQATGLAHDCVVRSKFQSLERDSVCSSLVRFVLLVPVLGVSIS